MSKTKVRAKHEKLIAAIRTNHIVMVDEKIGAVTDICLAQYAYTITDAENRSAIEFA